MKGTGLQKAPIIAMAPNLSTLLRIEFEADGAARENTERQAETAVSGY